MGAEWWLEKQETIVMLLRDADSFNKTGSHKTKANTRGNISCLAHI